MRPTSALSFPGNVVTPSVSPRPASRPHCPRIGSMDAGTSSPEASTSPTKRDCVFIVNPNGANGKTGNIWKKLFPKLRMQLSDYNVLEKLTTGPHHAVQLTKEAIRGGASAVVAVGGDGTLHEVVNGFFEDGKLVQPKQNQTSSPTSQTTLGLLPMGTGSDFARAFGWDTDPSKAVDRIAKGQRKKIDIGRVVHGEERKERYFVNVADMHLSAKAGFFSGQHKRLGNLSYVIGALQAFQGHSNRDLRIRADGGEWKTLSNVTAICVGNSKYFGGGMKIAPSADPSSGDLDVIILRGYKWYDFILKMPKLYQGTHVDLPDVNSMRVRTLDVEEVEKDKSYGGTYLQADGEHQGFLGASFSVVPNAVPFFL